MFNIDKNNKLVIYSFIFLTGLMLSGCNGSSDKDEASSKNITTKKIVLVDTELLTNQSIELILFQPDDKLSNILWQQTSGEDVSLISDNTKILTFTATTPGEYSFSVDFSVNGSESQRLNQTINISESSNKISARLSHIVLSDNTVSLRTSVSESISVNTLKWQQVSGPQVTFSETNTQGDLAVFFNAPSVTKDTLLNFKVSASDGASTYIDHVTVLVEPALAIASNAYFEERVASVYPYIENSPYAESLVHCVYSNTLTSSCTLASLPLLAQEGPSLSIDNIMERVVVSHQWMGDRFKEFLINNDNNNDFKNLLRATTAIVISYDIRPSFYWAATGAIYLDAENFWLTPQERDTINEAPDYRADFGNDLQFVMPWRYVKDNDYATSAFSREQRYSRTPNDGFYRLASLLYHELAHANDFFPSTEWFSHTEQTRILDAATKTDFESDQLSVAFPLESQTMRALAQVSFAGETATTIQKSYLPADIQSQFSQDTATDFYAYSSLREDFAILFEELMMQSRFQVFRDVAITNQPTGSNISGQDYIVTWGQRGRIGEATIKPRVAFSASRILPEFDNTNAISAVPSPVAMIEGDNWIENLSISPMSIRGLAKQRSVTETIKKHPPLPSQFSYYQKRLPKH